MSEPTLLFLGCGDAALRHSRTLRSVARQCKRFYASRAGEKAHSFSDSYGGSGWFNSYAAGLEDQRIDVIVVTTPPANHLELTLAALRAGKHVVVEKPAFLSAAEFQEVRSAALRANRIVMVAENYFYKPSAVALRRVISSDEIGEIRLAWINAMKWQRAAGWRLDPAMAGGGPLFEGGVHWINLLANLGMAVSTCETETCGGPATSLTRIHYVGGAVAVLAYSWEMKSRLNGVRISHIYGTRGTITFESNGLFIRVHGRGTVSKLLIPNPRDLMGTRAMWQDFIAAASASREPRFTLENAQRDIELLTAAAAPMPRGPKSASSRRMTANGLTRS